MQWQQFDYYSLNRQFDFNNILNKFFYQFLTT